MIKLNTNLLYYLLLTNIFSSYLLFSIISISKIDKFHFNFFFKKKILSTFWKITFSMCHDLLVFSNKLSAINTAPGLAQISTMICENNNQEDRNWWPYRLTNVLTFQIQNQESKDKERGKSHLNFEKVDIICMDSWWCKNLVPPAMFKYLTRNTQARQELTDHSASKESYRRGAIYA